MTSCSFHSIFFFNDTATTEIYTLSLHDALPIFPSSYISCLKQMQYCKELIIKEHFFSPRLGRDYNVDEIFTKCHVQYLYLDRKSTRLNSSHVEISYAVFCLKKKNNDNKY